MRRSEFQRELWRAYERGEIDEELKREAETNPCWNGTEPRPIDPRRSGWWWVDEVSDAPRTSNPGGRFNLLGAICRVSMNNRAFSYDLTADVLSRGGMLPLLAAGEAEHELLLRVDLTKPLDGQFLLLRQHAKHLQTRLAKHGISVASAHSKLGAERSLKNLPIFLRILDAKDSEPEISFAAIAKVIYPGRRRAEDSRVSDKVRDQWHAAQRLRDGGSQELASIASKWKSTGNIGSR